MAIAIVLLGALCVAAANLFMRRAIDAGGDAKAYLAVQLTFSIAVTLVLSLLRGGDLGWNPMSATLGLAAGLLLGAMMWGLGRALETGPPGLSLAALNSASVVPALALFGLFGPALGHAYSSLQGIGSVLVVVGLFWAAAERVRRGVDGRWLGYVAVAFGGHAAFLVFLEWRDLLMSPGIGPLLPFRLEMTGSAWFLPMVFVTAAAGHVVRFLWSVGRRLRRPELVHGLLGGAGMGGGSWCLVTANSHASGWQEAMLFPTYCVAIIVLSNVWAQVLYGERVNWLANGVCLLGVVAGTVQL